MTQKVKYSSKIATSLEGFGIKFMVELDQLKSDVQVATDRVSSLKVVKDALERELADLEGVANVTAGVDVDGAADGGDSGGAIADVVTEGVVGAASAVETEQQKLFALQQQRGMLERQLLEVARQRPQIVLDSTTGTMTLNAQAMSAVNDADLRHVTKLKLEAARHRLKLTGKVLTNMIEAREDATAESEKSMIEEKTTSVLQQRERDAVFEDMVAAQSAR
eukprot:gene4746-23150_t